MSRETATCHSLGYFLYLFIYLRSGLVYDSVLPLTPHNPSIIAQLLFLDVVFEKPGAVSARGRKRRSRYAPETQLQYSENVELDAKIVSRE